MSVEEMSLSLEVCSEFISVGTAAVCYHRYRTAVSLVLG